jgi:hypothetical protein
MRFHGSVEFWFDVGTLEHAQELIGAAGQAAHAALGDRAIDDPDDGGMWGYSYEPIDDAARAALDREDLGHGIDGRAFRY